MSDKSVKGSIEAILFAMGEAVELSRIARAVGLTEKETENCILDMILEYQGKQHGIQIIRTEDKYRLCTKPELYPVIKKAFPEKLLDSEKHLSALQTEVLTIIAYRQPVTRTEIDKIRGTDSYRIISELIELGLIEEKGRLPKRGHPLLYGTTDLFLQWHGISSVNDLPVIDYEKRLELEEESEQEIDSLTNRL